METTETHDIPASVSQRLLWMIKHYRAGYGSLNCPVVCRITGPLDVPALQAALDALVARHESLRTTFQGRGARLMQRVHPAQPLPLRLHDLSTRDDPAAVADETLAAELKEPIDPVQWPARAALWRISPQSHLFCLNLHHLVTDAWSTGLLLRDLCLLYERACGGDAPLPAPGWSPAEFVGWQKSLLAGEKLRRHQDYWRKQLEGARLPRLAQSVADETAAPRCDSIDLPRVVVAGLRALARQEQTTLFTVLLAIFQAQLWRTTGDGDISVASMFANRTRPELRETVALLAGMVLLRARVAEQGSFSALVRHCHSAVVAAFAYSDLPFQLLPSDIVDTGGGRADDVMFNVMADTRHLRAGAGVSFELVVPTDIGSRFPFELALVPVGELDLRAALFRAPDRLDAAGGLSFLSGYADLAAAVVARPDKALWRA